MKKKDILEQINNKIILMKDPDKDIVFMLKKKKYIILKHTTIIL
jgi:hypothetical protein